MTAFGRLELRVSSSLNFDAMIVLLCASSSLVAPKVKRGEVIGWQMIDALEKEERKSFQCAMSSCVLIPINSPQRPFRAAADLEFRLIKKNY